MDLIRSLQEIAPSGSLRTVCRDFTAFRRIAPKHNADLCSGTDVRRKEPSRSCRDDPGRICATVGGHHVHHPEGRSTPRSLSQSVTS